MISNLVSFEHVLLPLRYGWLCPMRCSTIRRHSTKSRCFRVFKQCDTALGEWFSQIDQIVMACWYLCLRASGISSEFLMEFRGNERKDSWNSQKPAMKRLKFSTIRCSGIPCKLQAKVVHALDSAALSNRVMFADGVRSFRLRIITFAWMIFFN